MKMAAAKAIASCISDADLCAEYIIPGVFDQRVSKLVAEVAASSSRFSYQGNPILGRGCGPAPHASLAAFGRG